MAASQRRLRTAAPWLLVLGAVLALPLIVRHAVATEIWIFAILALAFNLLLGYTGLLSFGQATFFGAAGYVAGYLLKQAQVHLLLVFLVGILVGVLSAALVGYFCTLRAGLYFIMLTFAFNQMAYFIAYQWTSVTGGEDGMPGIPRAPLGLGPLGVVDLRGSLHYYALTAATFLVCLWLMQRIVESPLGKILQAIRDNEERAAAVGYPVRWYKCLAFTIAGGFSGLAGVLYAQLFGILPLDAIYWLTSGNIVFMTLIGGTGSLFGPIIGAVLFIWLSETVSVMWARWPLLLGLVFVIVLLFFRGGCVEAWQHIAAALSGRRRGNEAG